MEIKINLIPQIIQPKTQARKVANRQTRSQDEQTTTTHNRCKPAYTILNRNYSLSYLAWAIQAIRATPPIRTIRAIRSIRAGTGLCSHNCSRSRAEGTRKWFRRMWRAALPVRSCAIMIMIMTLWTRSILLFNTLLVYSLIYYCSHCSSFSKLFRNYTYSFKFSFCINNKLKINYYKNNICERLQTW